MANGAITRAMATQHYTFALRCEPCGTLGTARGTDNDNGPNFTVDEVSRGFRSAHHTPNPFAQQFICLKCGREVMVDV
jgi:hypothetical protein